MDSAGPRSNKERHYHRPDTGFDESAVVRIVATRKLARNGVGGSVALDWSWEVALPSSGGKARLAAAESRGPIASWEIERIRSGRVTAYTEVVHIG
jgi:hypothetical protein